MQYVLIFIYYFLTVYQLLLFGYVLLSWFPNFRGNVIHRFLTVMVEPYISKFRRIIPPIAGMDFSPIIGFLLIRFAITGIVNLINAGAF